MSPMTKSRHSNTSEVLPSMALVRASSPWVLTIWSSNSISTLRPSCLPMFNTQPTYCLLRHPCRLRRQPTNQCTRLPLSTPQNRNHRSSLTWVSRRAMTIIWGRLPAWFNSKRLTTKRLTTKDLTTVWILVMICMTRPVRPQAAVGSLLSRDLLPAPKHQAVTRAP